MVAPPFDGAAFPPPPPAAPARPAGLPPVHPMAIPPRPPLPSASAARPDGAQAGSPPLDDELVALGLTGMSVVDADAPRPPAPLWHRISTWVAVYGVVLALIAFWPVPVDSGSGGFLRWVTAHFPVLTYSRIEFGSNILLFVPFGVGLALLLPKLRYLVLPAALLVSLAIESGQAIFLAQRTPSLYDILANVSGAALGLITLVVVEAVRRRLTDPAGD